MTTKAKTSQSKFTTKVLSELNKTEADKQREQVESFVENSIIDCETQIAFLKTSELPKAQLALKRVERELEEAKKSFEKSKYSIASSFSSYVSNREVKLDNIDSIEKKIEVAKSDIVNTEEKIKLFQGILKDLSE